MNLKRHIRQQKAAKQKETPAQTDTYGYGEVRDLLQGLLDMPILKLSDHDHMVIPTKLRPTVSTFANKHGLKLMTRVIKGTDNMRVFVLAED